MDSVDKNFGLLIAFGLPGFLLMAGLPEPLSTSIASVLALECEHSVGSFLYLVPLSIGFGIGLSAIRWILVDSILHLTGLKKPMLNFAELDSKLSSYNLLVEHNYRFYQFYANTLVAILIMAGVRLRTNQLPSTEALFWTGSLSLVLAIASRDCLQRFYERCRILLGEVPILLNANPQRHKYGKKKRNS